MVYRKLLGRESNISDSKRSKRFTERSASLSVGLRERLLAMTALHKGLQSFPKGLFSRRDYDEILIRSTFAS